MIYKYDIDDTQIKYKRNKGKIQEAETQSQQYYSFMQHPEGLSEDTVIVTRF